jgi:hypothetical protein
LSKALVVLSKLGLVVGAELKRSPRGIPPRAVRARRIELGAMRSVVASATVLGGGFPQHGPVREIVRRTHLAERALEEMAHEDRTSSAGRMLLYKTVRAPRIRAKTAEAISSAAADAPLPVLPLGRGRAN